MNRLAAVFVGGAVGTGARALLAEAVVHDPGAWPWATLIANLAAVALLAHLTLRPRIHPALEGPGFCGGLSTFSTMQLELLWMLDAGHVLLACAYAAVSVVGGLALARGLGRVTAA